MASKSIVQPIPVIEVLPPEAIEIPVMAGVQCHRQYYVTQMPIWRVRELLRVREKAIERPAPSATNFAAMIQRGLNLTRVKNVAAYIVRGFQLNNPDKGEIYVLPAITVVFDPGAEYHFDALGEEGDLANFGILRLPPDTKFNAADGQHRAAGAGQAAEMLDAIAAETLTVTLYLDQGPTYLQTVFVDINENAVKVNTSTLVAMSHQRPTSELTRAVVSQLPFTDRFAVEATSINKAEKRLLFPLNGFEKACKLFVGKSDLDAQAVAQFWNAVAKHMPIWQQAFKSDDCRQLRQDTFALHMIAVWAIARAGQRLRELHGDDYLKSLAGLETINWHRSNVTWDKIGFTNRGTLAVNATSEGLLADYVFNCCKGGD